MNSLLHATIVIMALYLITGQSGTGKSTLRQEFLRQGFTAVGFDEDSLAVHRFIESGELLSPEDYRSPRKQQIDWLNEVNYKTDPQRFQDIENTAISQSVFVFGGADDTPEYYGRFTTIFALMVDAETLTHRLKTRTGNDWGKKPHELAYILERHKTMEQEFRLINAVLIDAARPVQKIADDILGQVT